MNKIKIYLFLVFVLLVSVGITSSQRLFAWNEPSENVDLANVDAVINVASNPATINTPQVKNGPLAIGLSHASDYSLQVINGMVGAIDGLRVEERVNDPHEINNERDGRIWLRTDSSSIPSSGDFSDSGLSIDTGDQIFRVVAKKGEASFFKIAKDGKALNLPLVKVDIGDPRESKIRIQTVDGTKALMKGYCGNKVRELGAEECDGTANCNPDCTLIIPGTFCGDLITQDPNDDGYSEECDGEANCNPDCTFKVAGTYCGDGVKQSPNSDGFAEECDGTSDCNTDCTLRAGTYCGDNIVQKPNDDGYMEQCDGTSSCKNNCEHKTTKIRSCNPGNLILFPATDDLRGSYDVPIDISFTVEYNELIVFSRTDLYWPNLTVTVDGKEAKKEIPYPDLRAWKFKTHPGALVKVTGFHKDNSRGIRAFIDQDKNRPYQDIDDLKFLHEDVATSTTSLVAGEYEYIILDKFSIIKEWVKGVPYYNPDHRFVKVSFINVASSEVIHERTFTEPLAGFEGAAVGTFEVAPGEEGDYYMVVNSEDSSIYMVPTCTADASCGNGIVEPALGEECDGTADCNDVCKIITVCNDSWTVTPPPLCEDCSTEVLYGSVECSGACCDTNTKPTVPTRVCSDTGTCGNTDSHCVGIIYEGTCGKSCTGTLAGSCGNTNTRCSGEIYEGTCSVVCKGTRDCCSPKIINIYDGNGNCDDACAGSGGRYCSSTSHLNYGVDGAKWGPWDPGCDYRVRGWEGDCGIWGGSSDCGVDLQEISSGSATCICSCP